MIMVQRLHAAIARPAPARRGIQLRLPFKTWPPCGFLYTTSRMNVTAAIR
ncbi:hypothetical protein [Candidatus Nitrospira inopinata]|jgi:hypothetical protein|nr:hypothetical protein [Candidatus Nitrospira inopinata]